ncbi:hypothetical protein VOI54_09960 [Tamlana sp. 2201CG12-4]|uniref:hypothetical protein n=1 Tax=Tamlana sp. 2201CG12-4 TaxID=3112582 RepID=UPI002DBB79EF|nr:hypothetical protein [Tamlana sp. 2201CG12-4]MEC3907342.1 hypothetical protein [Tamlana sp. 2201CG12-4]
MKIVVCAFSVYPDYPSSEGIVNRNWIEILKKENVELNILSLKQTEIINETGASSITSNTFSNYLYKILKSSKNSISHLCYRVANKTLIKFLSPNSTLTIFQYIWVSQQTSRIEKFAGKGPDFVFWSRILPIESLIPFFKAYKKVKFPLIVNINDPIFLQDNKKVYQMEEGFLKRTAKVAQCWTFPSSKLADYAADKYGLDRKRCFVIPHATKTQSKLYSFHSEKNRKLNFLYTGTFYKSAFTDEFKVALKRFSKLEISKNVEFTFILSQFDQSSIDWLKEAIPHVKIFTKLTSEKVLEITSHMDCVFVVDASSHSMLLKGKLIEAISFGIPVFAITYKQSIMDKVVQEYGGVSGYQDVENDISTKLLLVCENLNDENWVTNFCKKRERVMFQISEGVIFEKTRMVSEFALKRFLWENNKENIKPTYLENCNWP